MKILTYIKNKMARRNKLAILVSTLAIAVAVPLVSQAGFFPGRPTFDYNNYQQGNDNCADPNNPARNHGRCGSLDGPVFNSFVNTPFFGDEREFLDGFRSDQTGPGTHADPVTSVTDGAKEVTFRLYIHNNANEGDNCIDAHKRSDGTCTQIDKADGKGVARNTRVKIELPSSTLQSDALRAVGRISADNAAPSEVSDTVDMTSTRPFTVDYVPGSAKIFNNGPFAGGRALPDSVVTTGTPVGYDALDGYFPGCFDFIATVEIKVKVTPVPTPNISVEKQVRQVGTTDWKSEVAAKPGDHVQWLVNTKNIGEADLNDVVTRDVLPPHVQLDPGTVKLTDANGTRDLADGPLFAGGFNEGTYKPTENTLISFKTTVLGDFDDCQTRVRNVAHAKSTQTPNEVTGQADVIITKENCKPTNPVYSCDLLTAKIGENRTVTYTTNATASNGATISMYSYDFGDGTSMNTDKATTSHTYAKDGQYLTRVTVQFSVNGKNQTASGDKCAAVVNFTSTPPSTPPSTPGKPTTLVNTGPGEVAGLFGIATALGAIGYRWMLARRLG